MSEPTSRQVEAGIAAYMASTGDLTAAIKEVLAAAFAVTGTPPDGWFTFGSHIESNGPLEFSGEDKAGMPLFERLVGCPCGHSCVHGPHEDELDHEVEPARSVSGPDEAAK